MRIELLYIPLLVLTLSCSSSKKTQDPVSNQSALDDRPSWVKSRPMSGSDYIGIGIASKNRPDHIEVAKKNALNDLASEIKVNISGNSFLHTLEREYEFEESFMSSIQATTDEDLEGYQMQGTYDGSGDYWVYYRLSKAEHARIQREKREKAQGLSIDFYNKSKDALNSNNLKSALDLQLKALFALKEHWGEENRVELNGEQVYLENEIYNNLQRTMEGVRIEVSPSPIILTYKNEFRQEVSINTKFHAADPFMLNQVPLILKYQGIHKKIKERKRTGDNGMLEYVITDVEFADNSNELFIQIDMDAIISDEVDEEMAKTMIAALPNNELRVPIRMELPMLYISSSEKNLGQMLNGGELATILKGELTKSGFSFTNNSAQADLLINLQANTTQGGQSNDFYVSYLNLTLTVKDKRSGLVVFEDGLQSMKGVQLNYTKAGLNAYKKAGEELKKNKTDDLISAIL